MRKIVIVGSIVIIGLGVYYFLCLRSNRNNKLIQEGSTVIEKVEAYKTKTGKLPVSFEDIGVSTHDLFYRINDDTTNYIIWYGTSLGESKIYYSDSKKWEDFSRGF